MLVFELRADVLGLGRKGDRVVLEEGAEWPAAVVRPLPFNPGRLLLHLHEGAVTPLTPGADVALARLAADGLPLPPDTRGLPGRASLA